MFLLSLPFPCVSTAANYTPTALLRALAHCDFVFVSICFECLPDTFLVFKSYKSDVGLETHIDFMIQFDSLLQFLIAFSIHDTNAFTKTNPMIIFFLNLLDFTSFSSASSTEFIFLPSFISR